MADTFTIWKSGVLGGLGAPDNAITTDALWAWSSAEGGLSHLNPLNTTYFMAGAVPWNTLSSGLHVWSYLTIEDGINATVATLLNPDPAAGLPNGYDIIVDHLRRSIPRAQWGDACWQLNKWGTECGWLTTYYGAAPGTLIGVQHLRLIRNPNTGDIATYNELGKRHINPTEEGLLVSAEPNGYGDTWRDINQEQWDAIPTAIQPPPAPATVDLSPVLAAIAALKAEVESIKAKTDRDLA